MRKNWVLGCLAVIASVVGVVVAAVVGLWIYMTNTAELLHPDQRDIPSVAEPSSREWDDAIERGRQILRAGLAEQNLPGLSVAVGVDGDLVWAEGFGWADLENQVPVTPETLFRIGSASKVLTSVGVGLLLDEGRLRLDEEIQAYVPEFPKKHWPVTLRRLMGHLSGIRNDAGDEEPLLPQCERASEGLERFAKDALRFEPGTRYRYSSYGWILVSAAAEAAGGEPFFEFMRTRVFEPLGMRGTRADLRSAPIPHRATPYFPRFAADPRYGLHLLREGDFSCLAGAEGFLSTPSDLVRFALAIDGGKLLQPATVELLQTSQRLNSGEETGYGLGWDLETAVLAGEPTPMIGHDGESLGGMTTSFMTFPEHGIIVAVISNISFADTWLLGLGIAEAFVEKAKPAGVAQAPRARQGTPTKTKGAQ